MTNKSWSFSIRLRKWLHLPVRFSVYADYSTRGLKNRNKYMRAARLVSLFEQAYNRKIYTNSFTASTLQTFLDFCFETTPLRRVGDRRKYSTNSVIAHLHSISCMLKFAQAYGFKVELDPIRHCNLKPEESCAVYLHPREIQQLMDCSCLNKKERQVRDLFIIGCCTALRYSDYTSLSPANFINNRVSVLTRKTQKRVLVPFHEFIPQIIARNNNNYKFLQYNGTPNDFNKTLREICRKAGICNNVVISYMENRQRIEKIYQKWQLVSSHTARRSAATNMIQSGMSVPKVMMFTGHSTQTSFFRYLRFTLEDNAHNSENDTFFKNLPDEYRLQAVA